MSIILNALIAVFGLSVPDPAGMLGLPDSLQINEFRYQRRKTVIDSHYFRLAYNLELVDSLIKRNDLFSSAMDLGVLEYDAENHFRFSSDGGFWLTAADVVEVPEKQVFGKYFGAIFDCMHFYAIVDPPFVYVSIRLGKENFMKSQLGPASESCMISMERWRNPDNIYVHKDQFCEVAPGNELCDLSSSAE